LALTGLVLFIAEYLKGFGEIDILPLALRLFTAAMLFMWIHATWYELNYVLCKWLDPRDYAVPQGLLVASMIAMMVVILAILFVSVPRIERYVAVFTFYSFFNLYGSICTLSQIAYAVQETKKRNLTEGARIAIDAIQKYWVKNLGHVEKQKDSILFPYKVDNAWRSWLRNPYFIRLVICFIAPLLLLPIAIAARLLNSNRLFQASYVAMILILLISEVVIFLWRLKRDQRIIEAEAMTKKEDKGAIDNTDC
jgi:hypothetical protein